MNEEPILTSPAKILSPAGSATAGEERKMPRMRNMIAVGSGKGGVGKTWFSITLCHALAHKGDRVLLVDGDLGLANVDVQLAMGPERDLSSVIAGTMPLAEAICPFDGGAPVSESESRTAGATLRHGFDVLAGRSGSGALDTLSRGQIETLCTDISKVSVLYDHVIVDLAAGLNTHMMPLFAMTGKILVVMTDDPTSITDAYAFVKLVISRFPEINIQLVINRAEDRSQAERTYGAIRRAAEHFLQYTPHMLGFVPLDRLVTDAIRAQAPLITRYPQSSAGEQVEKLAELLRPTGPRGLI